MKTHYRLTGTPDAIAADSTGELLPHLYPDPDGYSCNRCVRQIKHTHTTEDASA